MEGEVPGATQSDLQCPRCAGQCGWDPMQGALVCASCGHARRVEHLEGSDAAAEIDYCPHAPDSDAPVLARSRVHQCQTCGGAVIFAGAALSERCAYCDGPVVLAEQDEGYRTMALIPFQLREETARNQMHAWIAGRWAAPPDLAQEVEKGRIATLYAPFFTFDSREAVRYMGTYTIRRNKRTITRTQRGQMVTHFDDLLVPASPHITPLIRDGVLHDFEPDTLRPYHPAYLAGYAAERHHLSVPEGLEANAADKDLLLRNRIQDHAGRRLSGITYHTDTTGLRYRRILLPVYILHYTYRGTQMRVVSCGLRGQTYGERPFSYVKLAGYAALLTFIALSLGLAWGAAGFL
ncbi:MAG: hypothetical protein AAGF60_04155 [Pseudomonadota bacterium]